MFSLARVTHAAWRSGASVGKRCAPYDAVSLCAPSAGFIISSVLARAPRPLGTLGVPGVRLQRRWAHTNSGTVASESALRSTHARRIGAAVVGVMGLAGYLYHNSSGQALAASAASDEISDPMSAATSSATGPYLTEAQIRERINSGALLFLLMTTPSCPTCFVVEYGFYRPLMTFMQAAAAPSGAPAVEFGLVDASKIDSAQIAQFLGSDTSVVDVGYPMLCAVWQKPQDKQTQVHVYSPEHALPQDYADAVRFLHYRSGGSFDAAPVLKRVQDSKLRPMDVVQNPAFLKNFVKFMENAMVHSGDAAPTKAADAGASQN